MASEAELAGVLAHEITHVTEKHTIRAIQKNKVIQITADESITKNAAIWNKLVDVTSDLVMAGFGRGEELESDRDGPRRRERGRLRAGRAGGLPRAAGGAQPADDREAGALRVAPRDEGAPRHARPRDQGAQVRVDGRAGGPLQGARSPTPRSRSRRSQRSRRARPAWPAGSGGTTKPADETKKKGFSLEHPHQARGDREEVGRGDGLRRVARRRHRAQRQGRPREDPGRGEGDAGGTRGVQEGRKPQAVSEVTLRVAIGVAVLLLTLVFRAASVNRLVRRKLRLSLLLALVYTVVSVILWRVPDVRGHGRAGAVGHPAVHGARDHQPDRGRRRQPAARRPRPGALSRHRAGHHRHRAVPGGGDGRDAGEVPDDVGRERGRHRLRAAGHARATCSPAWPSRSRSRSGSATGSPSGPHEGMVSEVTWRATKLRTKAGNLVVLPNAFMSKEAITNYSEPAAPTRLEVDVGVSYDVPPDQVKAALAEARRQRPAGAALAGAGPPRRGLRGRPPSSTACGSGSTTSPATALPATRCGPPSTTRCGGTASRSRSRCRSRYAAPGSRRARRRTASSGWARVLAARRPLRAADTRRTERTGGALGRAPLRQGRGDRPPGRRGRVDVRHQPRPRPRGRGVGPRTGGLHRPAGYFGEMSMLTGPAPLGHRSGRRRVAGDRVDGRLAPRGRARQPRRRPAHQRGGRRRARRTSIGRRPRRPPSGRRRWMRAARCWTRIQAFLRLPNLLGD